VKKISKRLTYANVMSSIAVFLLLGGASAFAASQLGKNTVGSKQLKKNAVTTSKIKNQAVTGAKLKLSSIGKVPNASHADNADNATNATNAGNANTVAGNTIRKFFYASNEAAGGTPILSLDGLTLTASCVGGVTALVATTSVSNSLIHAGGDFGFVEPFYQENDDFDTIDELDLVFAEPDSVQGTFTYAQPNGTVVTGVFESEEDAFSAFETDCVISGHAIG
jgi:hypothetical protein